MNPVTGSAAASPRLSVSVVAYEMKRELPRTIRSLSPAMQRGIDPADYEIVVIDNGSPEAIGPRDLETHGASVRWLQAEALSASPAGAANLGVRNSSSPLVGVMVDGARLASPGLMRTALMACEMGERTMALSVGFHLGPEPQQRSVANGYDQAEEDRLLEEVVWTDDGYRLFAISSWAESSPDGWHALPAESNAVFCHRALWGELGGLDEAFECEGGGLVNLDFLRRASELEDVQFIVLLGEGTFHQVHGGVTTSVPTATRWQEFHDEYVSLRGRDYAPPRIAPLYLGTRLPSSVG